MFIKILRVISIIVFLYFGYLISESRENTLKPTLIIATTICGIIAGALVISLLFV